MPSRVEAIRQALESMEPCENDESTVSFSGPVTQVNIIRHATINIEQVSILAGDSQLDIEAYVRWKKNNLNAGGNAIRPQPSPKRS